MNNSRQIANLVSASQNAWLLLTRWTIAKQFHFFSQKIGFLETEAPIDNVDLPGGVVRFVRGQVNSQRCNFLGISYAPHRLPCDKFGTGLFGVALHCDPLLE